MKFSRAYSSQRLRWWSLSIVTLVLAGVIGFLLYTSEDPHWGSGFWARWLSGFLDIRYLTARHIVNGVRKALHFFGYGGIGLLCWFYFYLWGLKKPLLAGLILTSLVAALDELVQSRTGFRFGKPLDVALDIAGALCMTGILRVLGKRRGGGCPGQGSSDGR
ncbi:MAG: VanZ family protein [Firmicutes bacterium]|nr:VanZ family protein [Bacillota bacterium]